MECRKISITDISRTKAIGTELTDPENLFIFYRQATNRWKKHLRLPPHLS